MRNANSKSERNNFIKFALSPIIKLMKIINSIKKIIKKFELLFLTKYDKTIKEKK